MPPNRSRAAAVLAPLVVVAVLLACWSWWFAPETTPGVAPRGPDLATPAHAAVPESAARASTTTPDDPAATATREAAGGAANATTGSLLVHVVWGDDQQPAVGLEVRVWRPNVDEMFDGLKGTTDATGTVSFDALLPGNVYPGLGEARQADHERAAIVAGVRTEVTLTIKPGMNCNGRVVDDAGAAVADAEIVLAGWAGGSTTTIARSAADGTFALRGITTHCHIGARKLGMKPSSLRQFTASEGSTVQFTIVIDRLGASLAGVVLDPDGKPIAGAVVRAGDRDQKNHTLADGASAMGPQMEQVRTDENGRFVFESVVPGKVPVAARARGLAPWQGTIEVAVGRREEITINLLPGVTLFGTVRDQASKPLEKVNVRAGDWSDIGTQSARSAADGTFRIEGLAAGSLPVVAEDDTRGKVTATLEVRNGEQRRWDPVLSAGLQLRGRVLDPDDKPLASVMVEAQLERPSRDDQWWAFENTDAEGRFVLNNCKEGSTIRVSIKRKSVFPELVLDGVMPSAQELIVHLPKETWVYLQGTVLGPDGDVLPNVHASPFMKESMGGSPAETVDAKTGAFRYGPYPPGTYSLRFSADGFPPIRVPERAVAPDETWDIGTLSFQRGGVLVVNPISAGTAPKLSLRIYDADGTWLENLEQRDGAWRSNPLPAGTHELHASGENVGARAVPFEIRADAETKLDVELAAGAAAAIECVLPAGTKTRSVTLTVRNGDQVVWRGNAWPRDGEPNTSLTLAAGSYTVEAHCGTLQATGTLVVGASTPGKLKLELKGR
jgi:protocatechuate 3,4-dioxygenase beta subunit